MRHDCFQPVPLIAVSIVAGIVGWSGHILLLPTALAFPILWARAQTRWVAALVSAEYFLAASRGLPQGVATFYSSDLWPGLLLWLCASVSFVGVHTALWTKRSRVRPYHYLAAMVLMAFPPLGIIGWAHPVTAAGILFPGWGWWGLAATTAGLMGLVTRMWPAVMIAFAGFWLWSAATWTGPHLPDGWQGVDLEMGSSLGRDTSIQRHRDLIATVKVRGVGGSPMIVLPESALGFWTPSVERLWVKALEDTDVTAVTGATTVDAAGYDNVLVAISATDARVGCGWLRQRARCHLRNRRQGPLSRTHAGAGLDVAALADVVRPERRSESALLRKSHCRSWECARRAADLLRATDRLAGAAIDARRPRPDHRRRQRMVDQRDVYRCDPAR